MASSPTSSDNSSFSSPFAAAQSSFSELPVMALKQKIIEKIMENRVTLIVGETGCGKSSQVPQFLLEENMEPIICTQPRRFAVVAVARMVAKARNCEVGGEVGYHIGHSRVFSPSSKIVFKTAGVLLDEMREKGMGALKYKVIVLDEVHERSVESDLVLVCVKQFLLRNKDLRVVLMSATADISRYREYFRDLGRDERVEVLAIPSTGQKTIFQKEVMYLEKVTELLGMTPENLSLRYCSGPIPVMAEANFKPELHKLIHELVIHIHKNEPDIEKSILVFLPTYVTLEQQWFLLKPFSKCFKVHILHSSIDTEQALKAMKISKSHRKVILATNVAESSVTIPQVGYVIDSCRSLQVFWDSNKKSDAAELVWVSKSQADQRKGRTGRTCDGHVYRLVTGSFYGQLEDFESPAILRLSLRQHVLLMCCAESKAINEPKALLQKAMDPPNPEVVEDALDLLVHMRAVEKVSGRGRHQPTFYGRLLASFTLSFDASVLILKFGDIGMLREGILLGIMMDLQPLPILRPFGLENKFVEHTESFYSGNSKSTGLGRKEELFMGNFCAFQFWQRVFKDKWRLEQVKKFTTPGAKEDLKILLPQLEEEWCSIHNLIVSALHQVSDIYEEIVDSLHRFRPKCLLMSEYLPPYYHPYEFQHTCNFQRIRTVNGDAMIVDHDDPEREGDFKKCLTVPFVRPGDFQTDELVKKFASIVKEMKMQFAEYESNEQNGDSYNNTYVAEKGAPLCRYFANGLCNRGAECWFSHSLQSKKPLCKFIFSLQGCRNGDSCFFSHDTDSSSVSQIGSRLSHPDDEVIDPDRLLQLFPVSSDGCVLLLEDIDLHFSSHLNHLIVNRHNDGLLFDLISTSSQTDTSSVDPSAKYVTLLGLSHPYQTIMSKYGGIPWKKVKCLMWFPRFDHDNFELQKKSLQTFFTYLAIRLTSDSLHEVQVILAMNNLRFAKLQVEKVARESFFFLKDSFPYDDLSFGKLFDGVPAKRAMATSKPITYVFEMYLPPNFQFGDYSAAVRKCLASYV